MDGAGVTGATAVQDTVAAAFAAQRAGAEARRASFDLAARRAALARLRDAVIAFQPRIIQALAQDFAKPKAEVILTEILPLLQEIRHARRNLRRWMRPRLVAPTLATFGTRALIRPEPRGTCLIIAPWNYPFQLALGPLVSALAAGNSAIVKPSELTPATSALIAELVRDCFPPDLVHVIEGSKDVAEAALALPFDHIFFTGSPEVGRLVMAAAARHLSSVTLELGGKSPVVIGPGADLARAARWVAWGKFANAGQTCIAPDHVLVHDSIRPAFVAALRGEIARAYGADPLASPDLAAIVTDRHAARLRDLLAGALAGGARLVAGGDPAAAAQGRRMAPTLIEAVTPEMAIDQQEIFGPILPVIGFSDPAAVIARINAGPKPLALYIFDRDRGFARRIIAETSSGAVGVNLTMLHYSHAGLPFGGIGMSGQGAAHGHWGFRAFSHEKPVLENRFSALPWLFPPYRGHRAALIAAARRLLG